MAAMNCLNHLLEFQVFGICMSKFLLEAFKFGVACMTSKPSLLPSASAVFA